MNPTEQQLLQRHLNGVLTAEELPALEKLLHSSREARDSLRLFATIDEGLSERALQDEASATGRRNPSRPHRPGASRLAPLIPWSIAAAACLALLLRPGSPPAADAEPPSDLIAMLVDEAEAAFAEGAGPEEVRFRPGSYDLEAGAVHLRFSNGADVILRAPAAFSIQDAFRMHLTAGVLRAIVPSTAHGFTVSTPGIEYEDFGTEFGVAVERDSGRSQLHVFEGRVDARSPGSSRPLSSITDGQSVRYDGRDLRPDQEPELARYPSPGRLGFLRWQKRLDQVTASPNLIGFFPLQGDARNAADAGTVTSGVIHGARWVQGRWPGKQALLFDRDDDYMTLSLPGEYEELTYAIWARLDRYDFSHNAILNSDGWSEGDVHWQLARTGQSWLAAHNPGARLEPTLPVPTGQWVHLAATISRKTGKSRAYLNGKPAGSRSVAPGTVLRPGSCRLGNWLLREDWPHVPVRALRGRIDELAIWDRALSADEIQQLADRGKPAALWAVSLP